MPLPSADAIDAFIKETADEGGVPLVTRLSDGTATVEIRFPMGSPYPHRHVVTWSDDYEDVARQAREAYSRHGVSETEKFTMRCSYTSFDDMMRARDRQASKVKAMGRPGPKSDPFTMSLDISALAQALGPRPLLAR